MTHKTEAMVIEQLVDSIKGYFSITGLLLVGIYLIKNPMESFLHLHWVNYLGGASAILVGAITGVWYSLHLLKTVLPADAPSKPGWLQRIVVWTLVALSFLLILTVVLGAVSMSCGAMFS